MSFTYGVIEGLYDDKHQWSWAARHAYVEFCQQNGQQFYIYAPKNDPFLRERWREPWPDDELNQLKSLADAFRSAGIAFGIGFTPYQLESLDKQSRQCLREKLALINGVNPSILCILFDDFSCKIPHLAETQSEVVHFMAGLSKAEHFMTVGTWYSSDPLLERVYGAMPENYQEDLGRSLDPGVDIFWTGNHVISSGYDESGLSEIAQKLRRKPFLWDNYPVNDPKWLQDRLRLYALTGRPWKLEQWTHGHAVNPMIQPWLSMIPLATLNYLYQRKEDYQPHQAFKQALKTLCSQQLAKAIDDELVTFSQEGNQNLSDFTRNRLTYKFMPLMKETDEPFVKEILSWIHPDKNSSLS
ncbi:O-GlcNAcase [invertebrate metagenome]|uniref:O-GlcNAcase n=1 Tax=invertebrate metagenome TaxID=1711999 RepID=A0A2H9TAB0_9ZZZZ